LFHLLYFVQEYQRNIAAQIKEVAPKTTRKPQSAFLLRKGWSTSRLYIFVATIKPEVAQMILMNKAA